ncbi:lysophosphatidic acid receptor 5-like [Trichomycterus rosablanca]|uniref:lysophosphatidic acid receptor 5-like n=1 Tax=Trichomycterus rosablanca TaxID=2290929 RepID=UPI002F360BCC
MFTKIFSLPSRILNMAYTTPEERNGTNISQTMDNFQSNFSSTSSPLTSLAEILMACNKRATSSLYLIPQMMVLLFALPANANMLFLFLKNRKTLSPSEVLGLNLALLGVLFCLTLPLDIYTTVKGRLGILVHTSNTVGVLTYTGCPLLLTSMCLERYVAVSHPVLFMRLGKSEYRAACSAIIWILTGLTATVTFIFTLPITAVYLSVIINVLFLIMVACLLGIVCVLCKKGPGDAKSGEKSDSPKKKKALKNIMIVLVLSTIVYFPLLGLAPYLLIVQELVRQGTFTDHCKPLYICVTFPYFGVCIGPLFYIARVRQMLCIRKNQAREKKSTTIDQKN